MGYKYDTHVHTSMVSACASLTAEQIVDLYVQNGYTGIFITDHFIHGNCHEYIRKLDYKNKIIEFYKGYKAVKEAAKGKLDVFFGFEDSYRGTDFLVYGPDLEDLLNMPEIDDMDFKSLIIYMNNKGYLTVQAHPFREANYIDHIRIYPETIGVETLNAARNEKCNKFADFYADLYEKPKLAGSDIHHTSQKLLSGLEFDEKIESVQDFIERVLSNKQKLFIQENNYKK